MPLHGTGGQVRTRLQGRRYLQEMGYGMDRLSVGCGFQGVMRRTRIAVHCLHLPVLHGVRLADLPNQGACGVVRAGDGGALCRLPRGPGVGSRTIRPAGGGAGLSAFQ